jgi:hypothetical protein
MAKIVEFYVPQRFRKVAKWLPPNGRGKLLEFQATVRKSARQDRTRQPVGTRNLNETSSGNDKCSYCQEA